MTYFVYRLKGRRKWHVESAHDFRRKDLSKTLDYNFFTFSASYPLREKELRDLRQGIDLIVRTIYEEKEVVEVKG